MVLKNYFFSIKHTKTLFISAEGYESESKEEKENYGSILIDSFELKKGYRADYTEQMCSKVVQKLDKHWLPICFYCACASRAYEEPDFYPIFG